MQITAEIPVCLSPSGGHRHSLNSILREPLTIRIGNSSELFGRTITKSKDLRKLQQNLFYKLPECFANDRIQRNNSRFFHCIVSFLLLSSICPISATHGKTEVPSAPLTEGTGRNLLQNLQFSGFLLSMYQDCGDSPIQHV